MNRLAGLLAIMLSMTSLTGVAQGADFPQDKGADKLDVSSYPETVKPGYKILAGKCARCHSLARTLNTSMTPEEWNRCVKKMTKKPGADINETQAKQILEFLVYDQRQRKDRNRAAFHPAQEGEMKAATN